MRIFASERRDKGCTILHIGWTTTMFGRAHAAVLIAIAGTMYPLSAFADMYVWTDKAGVTNVSNLPPPEGTRIQSVTYAAPKDAAQEAAFREAMRQAEMRALNERVQQLQAAVEQARRDPPAPTIVVAQAPAPPPPAPQVIVVSPPPAPVYPQPVAAGCDFSWPYNCGFGFWPGFYPTTVVVRDSHFRHHRHPIHHARPRHGLNTPPIVPVRKPGPWRN
jgi:hypothetical protein